MGFGTLFFGYFLLLNIVDPFISDLVMALIIMLATYKLSPIMREFKITTIILIPFSVFSLFTLVMRVAALLNFDFSTDTLVMLVGFMRYAFVAAIGFFIFLGIQKLAREVEIKNLEDKSHALKYFNLGVYSALAVLQIPFPVTGGAVEAIRIISVIALLLAIVACFISLTAIYSAYMHICMPEDLEEKPEKPSKFGFVNKFREHEEEKRREYADYKIDSMRKKANKSRKKRKK